MAYTITDTSNASLLNSYVYAPLGDPVLPREYSLDANRDIYPALVSYYKYVPIKRMALNYFTDRREWAMPIAPQYPDYPAETSSYFYLGVLHYAVRHQLGQSRFDEYLLGFNYSIPNYDPERTLLNATLIDMNVGDVYYEEDHVNDLVRWVVGGTCVLSVLLGFGHKDLEKVPKRHIEWLSHIVRTVYYQRLISIRTTGKFDSADFDISAELLMSEYDKSVEAVKSMTEGMGLFEVTIG